MNYVEVDHSSFTTTMQLRGRTTLRQDQRKDRNGMERQEYYDNVTDQSIGYRVLDTNNIERYFLREE